jgi:hypothetical protein
MPCLEPNEYSTRALPRMSAGGHQFVKRFGGHGARQAGFGGEQAHRGDEDLSIDLVVIMTNVRVSCHFGNSVVSYSPPRARINCTVAANWRVCKSVRVR